MADAVQMTSPPPYIHIDFAEQGKLRIVSNITNQTIVLGLLVQAPFFIMTGSWKEQPLVQPVNGSPLSDQVLKRI